VMATILATAKWSCARAPYWLATWRDGRRADHRMIHNQAITSEAGQTKL
jgi:hypothetical protein